MTKYIDAEEFWNNRPENFDPQNEYARGWNECNREYFNLIENATTADVVEVVRCRDCKYRYDDLCPMYYVDEIAWDDDGWTETDHAVHDLTNDDDFCSRGERRSE